jgi:hypothetical protein
MTNRGTSSNNLQIVLDYWAPILDEFGAIPFFGTLLGLTRDGKLIENDDDVDFILPFEHRSQVEQLILASEYRTIYSHGVEENPWCIQAQKNIDSHTLVIDFYFYHLNSSQTKIVLPFNFFNNWNDSHFHLHVPINLVFPLIKRSFGITVINFPQQSEALVRFLYGSKWDVPLNKFIDYRLKMISNEPNYRFPSMLEKWIVLSWRFVKKFTKRNHS